MNYLKLSLLLFVGVSVVNCKESTAEKAPKAKKEILAKNLETVNFTIKGMTCAMGCAKTIEKELTSLDGVKTATVSFEKESATVTFDKTSLSLKSITKVVEAVADGKSYKVSDVN